MVSAGLEATDGRRSGAGSIAPLIEVVERLGAASALLLREKQLCDRHLFELAGAVRARLDGRLMLSGRPDVALAVDAEGVHLPADGLAACDVRRAFPDLLVGISTHRREEVAAAIEHGAHYVTFGPIYDTPAKRPYGPPQGLDRLAAVAELPIPVLAIGGIDADRVGAVVAAGAHGVAAIRALAERGSAEAVAAALARALADLPGARSPRGTSGC